MSKKTYCGRIKRKDIHNRGCRGLQIHYLKLWINLCVYIRNVNIRFLYHKKLDSISNTLEGTSRYGLKLKYIGIFIKMHGKFLNEILVYQIYHCIRKEYHDEPEFIAGKKLILH